MKRFVFYPRLKKIDLNLDWFIDNFKQLGPTPQTLMFIATYADKRGKATVTVDQLMQHSRRSRRTLQRHIQHLERGGYIKTLAPNVYQVVQ